MPAGQNETFTARPHFAQCTILDADWFSLIVGATKTFHPQTFSFHYFSRRQYKKLSRRVKALFILSQQQRRDIFGAMSARGAAANNEISFNLARCAGGRASGRVSLKRASGREHSKDKGYILPTSRVLCPVRLRAPSLSQMETPAVWLQRNWPISRWFLCSIVMRCALDVGEIFNPLGGSVYL